MDYICDKCRNVIATELQVRKEGDFEITFFCCDKCGKEYITLVTDSELRKNIKRYRRMVDIISQRNVPERFIQKSKNLRKQNIERGSELRDIYIESQKN